MLASHDLLLMYPDLSWHLCRDRAAMGLLDMAMVGSLDPVLSPLTELTPSRIDALIAFLFHLRDLRSRRCR